MTKLLWVLSPLLVYAAAIAVCALRGRMPSRFALNVQTSLLLVAYLLATAGLGVFWVANQQLPVFDVHYLFGYATLILVTVHLAFNLPIAIRWLRRTSQDAPADTRGPALIRLGKAVAILAAAGMAFFLGMRHGSSEFTLHSGAESGTSSALTDAVIRYHEFSSESRTSVVRHAPNVEWGDAPPAFKQYPGVPKLVLERGSLSQRGLTEALRAPGQRNERVRLAELGEMLFLSAGITGRRGGHALRAAPSSGGLFPSELYVIARHVDGLDAGLYHYDPEHHRLDILGAMPDTQLTQGTSQADMTVVLTSVFRRTGYKYRDRAYRYAVADGGHLLENLRLAAHSAGLEATLVARFDEQQAARTIGVDDAEEGILAVMDLQRGAGKSAGAIHAGPDNFSVAPVPLSASLGATGVVHRATSLRAFSASATPREIALPPPLPASATVTGTILQRRSQRRFHAGPLSIEALSSMLADVAQAPQLSDAIGIHLVVNRIDGLSPGIYRYLRKHVLEQVREGEFAAAAQSAALSQEVIGGAAVVLVLSADRERMLAEGPRGYRHGFIEAGMLGERWLLGAVARGLAACPVGAFYDEEAAALIGVDARREWVLHFAALGRMEGN